MQSNGQAAGLSDLDLKLEVQGWRGRVGDDSSMQALHWMVFWIVEHHLDTALWGISVSPVMIRAKAMWNVRSRERRP